MWKSCLLGLEREYADVLEPAALLASLQSSTLTTRLK